MTPFREYCEGSINDLEAAIADFPSSRDALTVHSAGISLESDYHCAVTLEEIVDVAVRAEVLALLERALVTIDGQADPQFVESVRQNIAAVLALSSPNAGGSAVAHIVVGDPDPLVA